MRIESIYYLRFVAMLLVVFVHVTGTFSTTLPLESGAYEKYHFINRIARIEAGIFIMITGLVFFYNLFPKTLNKFTLKDYYKKRVTFIIIPYLIWALFYEMYSVATGDRALAITEIPQRILTGTSYYQLHFVFLIVQFYLFLPLFVYAAQSSVWLRKYLWLVGFVIEYIYYFLNLKFDLVEFSLFFNSLSTFLLGGWLGIYYVQQRKKAYSKSNWLLGTVTLLFGSLAAVYYYQVYEMNNYYFSWDPYKLISMVFYL